MKKIFNKKFIITVTIVALLLGSVGVGIFSVFHQPQPAKAAWYTTGGTWNYRKQVTFTSDVAKIPSTQSNFPALISITDTDLAADAQDDGDDILFTSSDQTTKLSHEIESFNGTTGALVAWVKVPSLATSTVLYMYYGNASCSSQQDATNVWDANYKGAWHLGDAGPTTANDSTSNANNGTQSGGVTFGATGKVNSATSFDGDGSGQYISIPAFTYTGSTAGTISAWVLVNTNAHDNTRAVSNFGKSVEIATTKATTNWRVIFGAGNEYNVGTFSYNVWAYVTLVQTSSGWNFYDDGSLSTSGSNVISDQNDGWYFGWAGTSGRDEWDGRIDEVRISSTARSADWIATEYNNQNDPSSFYSVKTETAKLSVFIAGDNVSTDWYTIGETVQMDWKYRRKITVDHTKVPNTDQSEFPMLVKIADATDPIFTKAQADGDDILFTNAYGNTKLSHEIEKFDPGGHELWAWVKIPKLTTALIR